MRVSGAVLSVVLATAGFPLGAAEAQEQAVPDSVTLAWLQTVFARSLIESEVDADGDLVLRVGAGLTLWLSIDDGRKLLNFFAIGAVRPDASEGEKLAFVNELNSNVIGATFYLAADDLLVADSYLFFDSGISDRQVMSRYRWFRDAVIAAIRRDRSGLLGSETRATPRCDAGSPGCRRVKT